MYKKGSKAIQSAFKKLWDGLPAQFAAGTRAATTQIKDEFDALMDNHTLKGDRIALETAEREAKLRLQQEVLNFFADLKDNWSYEIDTVLEQEDDLVPEEIEINIDDLFNPEGLDEDDADLELNYASGGEEDEI